MSQHDYNIADSDGATVRADINDVLAAIATLNSGSSAPGTTFSYQLWADTTNAVLKQRNAANSAWVELGDLGTANFGFTLGMPRAYIAGLTYANNGSDATNDIDIAAGRCRDATNARDMVLAAGLTKRLDAAWAVGTNAGGLDTGSIGNSDYYIWLIERSDTGVIDALFSLSSTAPTMPANYDYKRLIGWFKRVGGAIVAFDTYEIEGGGLELSWDTPTLDINLSNTLTTSRRTDAVKVPLNFSVTAILSITAHDGSSGFAAIVECPDRADVAVGSNNPEVGNIGSISVGAPMQTERWVRTSATGTIAARASLATVDTYQVSTFGFRWERRT